MGKRPSLQFYPGDWLRDPAVRGVSLAARGLWIDMLCLMFECDRKGYLMLNGKPPTLEQIARMTGCSTEDASRLTSELETSGAFSRTEHGVIFSRRMVRDEGKREKCSIAGKKGGGNPAFKGLSKGGSKPASKRNANPSSSSSTSVPSSEVSEEGTPSTFKGSDLPQELDTVEFREAWRLWEQHRVEIRHPLKPTMREEQIRKLAAMGAARAVACLRNSIAGGWRGLFEPDPPKNGSHGKQATFDTLFDEKGNPR